MTRYDLAAFPDIPRPCFVNCSTAYQESVMTSARMTDHWTPKGQVSTSRW